MFVLWGDSIFYCVEGEEGEEGEEEEGEEWEREGRWGGGEGRRDNMVLLLLLLLLNLLVIVSVLLVYINGYNSDVIHSEVFYWDCSEQSELWWAYFIVGRFLSIVQYYDLGYLGYYWHYLIILLLLLFLIYSVSFSNDVVLWCYW